MKVVLIGTGNIAWYFAKQMQHQKRFQLVQVFARSIKEGEKFSSEFNVPHVNHFKNILADADIYVLAVNDNAVLEVANQIKCNNALVIHNAGSQSLDILKNASPRNGIIWPIYSINKGEEAYARNIPLIIETNQEADLALLKQLASCLSDNISVLNFPQRRYLHLNAVLVNNFGNHLMTIASKICEQHQIGFDILWPIISQTADRIIEKSPFESQTGPAKRGDELTINNHLALIKEEPLWQAIYKSVSDSIEEMYRSNSQTK